MGMLPTLAKYPCGYLNLNDLAEDDPDRLGPNGENRYLDPEYAGNKIKEYHKRAGIQWSYGGYLEKRHTLWSGVKYLGEADTFLHLGVDFNVDPGTSIAVTRPCIVVRADNDSPEEYGWGGRVIVRLKHDPVYLIYAHLNPQFVCRVGQELARNNILGTVGTPPYNGGWFSHFHTQALTLQAYECFDLDINKLDGYGKISERGPLSRKCPDPLPYLQIW